MPSAKEDSEAAATGDAYWKANIRLLVTLMVIWFVVSYGFGVLLVEPLNEIPLFGFKLGFWWAQQGSIYVFIGLIFYYCRRIAKIEASFGLHEADEKDAESGETDRT